MDLQELIARGRFMFSRAPARLRVFSLVNGRRSAKAIAAESGRRLTNTLKDLQALRDVGLIEAKRNAEGTSAKKDRSTVYEKSPVARHISNNYFNGPVRLAPSLGADGGSKKPAPRAAKPIPLLTEGDVLDICRQGENQLHEFKGPGVDMSKIAKEVAAFLHNRQGGIVFYGIADDGKIVGTDVPLQRFDQPFQNTLRHSIAPAPSVHLRSMKVLGTEILLVLVPPWNGKDVYYLDNRAYVRRGTNAFPAKPEEIKKLHRGEFIA